MMTSKVVEVAQNYAHKAVHDTRQRQLGKDGCVSN